MEPVEPRPPVPPFTLDTARQKVKAAQDAWNTCDPEKVAGAYTPDSQWRNRDEFFQGREATRASEGSSRGQTPLGGLRVSPSPAGCSPGGGGA